MATNTIISIPLQEAPTDGTPYARQDSQWISVVKADLSNFEFLENNMNIISSTGSKQVIFSTPDGSDVYLGGSYESVRIGSLGGWKTVDLVTTSVTASSLTPELIDAGDARTLTTKEWVEANSGGVVEEAPHNGLAYIRNDSGWEQPSLELTGRTSSALGVGISKTSAANSITIPEATTSLSGVLSATDKTIIQNIPTTYVSLNLSQIISGTKTFASSVSASKGISIPAPESIEWTGTNSVLFTGDTLNSRLKRDSEVIADSGNLIAGNGMSITDNGVDITITNLNDLTGINDSIAVNAGNISTNTGNIAANLTNISNNTSGISTNTGNISTNTSQLLLKADKSKVLETDNTSVYTPVNDYEPATKLYVDSNRSSSFFKVKVNADATIKKFNSSSGNNISVGYIDSAYRIGHGEPDYDLYVVATLRDDIQTSTATRVEVYSDDPYYIDVKCYNSTGTLTTANFDVIAFQ